MAKPPTLEELARIFDGREEFLSSFAVRGEMRRVDPAGGGQRGEYRLVVHDGDIRCVARWGETRTDFAYVDGTATSLSGNLEKWQTAVIEKNEAPLVPWGVPIHTFLTEVYNRRLSDFCREIAARVVVEGNRVIVEAIRSEDDPRHEFRVRVLLEPAQNFAVVGVNRSVRAKGSETWDPHARVTMTGLREYRSSGHFLPSEASYSLYTRMALPGAGAANDDPFRQAAPTANETLPVRMLVGYEGKFSDWVVPAEASSDTFVVSIPDGVNVHDKIRGVDYIAGRSDPLQAGMEAVRRDQESLRPESRRQPSGKRPPGR